MEVIRAGVAYRACCFGKAPKEGASKSFSSVILLRHPPVSVFKKSGVFSWMPWDSITKQYNVQGFMPNEPVRNLSFNVSQIDNGVTLKNFPCR